MNNNHPQAPCTTLITSSLNPSYTSDCRLKPVKCPECNGHKPPNEVDGRGMKRAVQMRKHMTCKNPMEQNPDECSLSPSSCGLTRLGTASRADIAGQVTHGAVWLPWAHTTPSTCSRNRKQLVERPAVCGDGLG